MEKCYNGSVIMATKKYKEMSLAEIIHKSSDDVLLKQKKFLEHTFFNDYPYSYGSYDTIRNALDELDLITIEIEHRWFYND